MTLRGFSNRNDGVSTGQALMNKWVKIATNGATSIIVMPNSTNCTTRSVKRFRMSTGLVENGSRTVKRTRSPGVGASSPLKYSRSNPTSAAARLGQGAEPCPVLDASSVANGSMKNS
jgi:hypothetical protein